jgi:hypothetical protein
MTSYNPNTIFQLLVLAIFGDFSSSNAIFQLLVLTTSWFRNNIFVGKQKARFPLLVIHENASVVASNNRLERLCHAGSNSSDTGRDILNEIPSSASSICHSKPSKAS